MSDPIGQAESVCNIDGRISAESEAVVPVLDRGFLFADSVYEVFRTRAGVPFAWQDHFGRLQRSADGIDLVLDLPEPDVRERVARTLLASTAADERYVRLIVTRGTATMPSIDPACVAGPPRWIVMVRPLPRVRGEAKRVVLVPRPADGHEAGVKSGDYRSSVVALGRARARGATDSVFVNADGHVAEASTANVWIVRGGVVSTPPLAAGLLPGVTRRHLFECCRGLGVQLREELFTADDLRAADEVFLTATMRDVAPVVEVDGAPVGAGAPGELSLHLLDELGRYCDRRARERDAPLFPWLESGEP